ncbi:MAG TPA: multidrug efflux RND transporter permease subunit [Pirellulales bacterium]|jgi:hydrophobe/amphiphile efflux-1 (HAE1) family protein|nr:multidrug efflux RND transporter permease subunit [Pirellulales bacterium]
MISRFFIDRPIFASVLSIVITLTGAIAVISLPIAQYPNISPPTVQVAVTYPGASAQVMADTIAAPIEQQVNGVENMLYMSSQSNNDGTYNLTVTFDLGTDLNTALVMVQNRVALAMPQLPNTVQQQGITIKKKSPNILMVVCFYSPDRRYDDIYLSNYATINCKDELFRLEGVADITYLGQRDYSIRAWLDPELLASRNITAAEVSRAISQQNLAAAPGQLGQQPSPPYRATQLTFDTLGRLKTPEQFGNVIIKEINGSQQMATPQLVRLHDVARIEMGAANYNQSCTLNGRPSVGLAIYQLPGTNALDVADRIRAKMESLKKRFPDGLDYQIGHDTTPYVAESVHDVVQTLFEAVILVAIVVLVFLQNWRSALIPLIAVPVAIVGTFAVMKAFGFSLNNISLFGLVLAIGIVVDDAIVVVENVERWLEQGLPSKEAARRAMDEVTSPVLAVAIVLCAVFVPCAFISGIPGQFFRQFAVTIAVSTVISAFNSLTLSPALAALLLKPHGAHADPVTRLLNFSLGWFFRLFNSSFNWATAAYAGIVGWSVRLCVLVLLLYGGLLGLTYVAFSKMPTAFIPQQDQGWLLVNVQLPDSSSLQQTQAVMHRLEEIALHTKGVHLTTAVCGMSILLTANSSNFGSIFVILDPFEKRLHADMHADAIMNRLRKEYAAQIHNAMVSVFGAPPVPGIGIASGFKLMVEDRGAQGLPSLQKNTDTLVKALSQVRGLIGVFTLFRSNTPQLYMDIDRTKVRSMGVTIDDLNQTLQIYLGSLYVNNFNAFGRYWQVNIMADGKFRNRTEDINQIKVRNSRGEMVPLNTLVDLRSVNGPVMVTRYNLYPAAPINGGIYPTFSTGQAIQTIDRLAQSTLPRAMKTEWTELTLMQIRAGNTAMYVFGLAVIFVFLALAALYESWSLPLAVILVVPMCLLCSVVGVAMAHMAINIFVQIGFVVLVGLACKNAILIVEFAKQLHEEGQPLAQATREACRLRLRPILMTSLAFILGVLPMVLAEGAGAEMRRALGTAVFSGMLGVTLFGIFLTPVFFYVIESLGETRLLTNPRVRQFGAAFWSLMAGLLVALLMRELGSIRWPGVLILTVVTAVITFSIVTRLHRRITAAAQRK